jgi:hypothetical protein
MLGDNTTGKHLRENTTETTILTEYAKGEICMYSQNTTNIIPSDYLFEFTRFQFHFKLCFAVIISKAQGLSLKKVDIELREEGFSHMWLDQKLVLKKAYIYWRQQEKSNM